MTTSQLSPVLSVVEGTPVVSSLDVAKHFDKRHDHLVRTIRALHRNSLEILDAPIFGDVEYADSKGEMRVAYWMTEEGFSLLVMGFTGKKALQWKLAYIKAFKLMRSELMGRPAYSPDLTALPRKTTGAERKPLAVAVNKIVGLNDDGPTRQKYMGFWRAFDAALGVKSIEDLTIDRLPAVKAFLELLVTMMAARPTPSGIEMPSLAGMTLKEQVDALYFAFEKGLGVTTDFLYEIERAMAELTKGMNLDHMDAVTRMHFKAIIQNTGHAFRDAMFGVQTSINTSRNLFNVLGDAAQMAGNVPSLPQ